DTVWPATPCGTPPITSPVYGVRETSTASSESAEVCGPPPVLLSRITDAERRCSSDADRSYANVRNGWGSATPPAVVLLHSTSSDRVCCPVSSWSRNVIELPLPAIHCEPTRRT